MPKWNEFRSEIAFEAQRKIQLLSLHVLYCLLNIQIALVWIASCMQIGHRYGCGCCCNLTEPLHLLCVSICVWWWAANLFATQQFKLPSQVSCWSSYEDEEKARANGRSEGKNSRASLYDSRTTDYNVKRPQWIARHHIISCVWLSRLVNLCVCVCVPIDHLTHTHTHRLTRNW